MMSEDDDDVVTSRCHKKMSFVGSSRAYRTTLNNNLPVVFPSVRRVGQLRTESQRKESSKKRRENNGNNNNDDNKNTKYKKQESTTDDQNTDDHHRPTLPLFKQQPRLTEKRETMTLE